MLVEITSKEAEILLDSLLNLPVQASLSTVLTGKVKIDPSIISAVEKLKEAINKERYNIMSDETRTPDEEVRVEETPVTPEGNAEGSGAPESAPVAPAVEDAV